MNFNVLQEPWIMVRDKQNKIKTVGLRQLLKEADQLLEITDYYPHQEYGIYRLVMTMLMDIYRPKRVSDLEQLIDEGHFSLDLIEHYFSECNDEGVSFDLFDENRPFLQVRRSEWEESEKPKSVAILNPVLPSGNNHIHFNHQIEINVVMTFAEAARALCSAYVFCTAGAQGYPSSVNGAPPIYTIVKGKNLFETLVYGMAVSNQYEKYSDEPVFWRNKGQVAPKKEVVETSLLMGLSFPSRRITLLPDDDCVAAMYYGPGMNYTGYESFVDPYVSYKQTESGRVNVKPDINIEPWRNLATIINCDQKSASLVVQQYKDITDNDVACITTYSVVTNQAAFYDEYTSEYLVPVLILKSPIRCAFLQKAIELCEEQAKDLKRYLVSYKLGLGYDKSSSNLNHQINNSIKEYFQQAKSIITFSAFEELRAENCDMDLLRAQLEKKLIILKYNVFEAFTEDLGLTGERLIMAEKAKKTIYSRTEGGI